MAEYPLHSPELAAPIESLGCGAVWIGGSPDTGLSWVEPALAETSSLQLATGIVNIWSSPASAVAESYHRIEKEYPGRVFAGHRGRPAHNASGRVPPFCGYLSHDPKPESVIGRVDAHVQL
jgi:hypothetical protein